MARKAKNKEKKQLPGNKYDNRGRRQVDLPLPLLRLMWRRSPVVLNITNWGVTKSWRLRTGQKQCNSNGKLLQPRLWNPALRYDLGFPRWHANIPRPYVAQPSSPEVRSWAWLVLKVTGACLPAFQFHCTRIGAPERECEWEWEWKTQDCTIIDPYASDQQFMQFTNAIGFQGKFYALSLQGSLAVVEHLDSHLKVTPVSTNRAVPSVLSRHFREYLVKSEGEILLVFLISKRSIKIVDDVEVFWLEFPRLSWVKMESIGNRTLFAGSDCCVPVISSKVGCRRNCVYFTQLGVDGWWVYDMGIGTISPGWNAIGSSTKSPVWDETM